MGCAMGMVKYLLFIFNLIFALSGLALLVMGVLIWKDFNAYNEVSDFLGTAFTGPPIFLIVVGSIIFVVAFFGCCGAIRESHCMVITFAVFLLIILLAEVAIGVIAFLHKDDIAANAEQSMKKTFDTYMTNGEVRKTYDALQSDLKCCGVEGPRDYIPLFGNSSVPATCCVVDTGNMCSSVQSSSVHQKGCYVALKDFISMTGTILGSVALGVALIEIVGIIFSLCLANSIKNEARRMGTRS